MITIVDYGLGNLRSVQKAFERINTECEITDDYKKIEKAEKLILPGVGHFKRGMKNLKDLDLIDVLNKKVIDEETPILGICLGMQLMTKYSEEGGVEGLGWIAAETLKFNDILDGKKYIIPHIGWNSLNVVGNNNILSQVKVDSLFYFVHSYYVNCNFKDDVMSATKYGVNFHSAFHHKNIYGVQFHPEKSHKSGLQVLKNFVLS